MIAEEEGNGIFVQFDLLDLIGHEPGHELARAVVAFMARHQNFADVFGEQIAHRALDEVGFLINKRGRGGHKGLLADVVP